MKTTPICTDCLLSCNAAGEPDFPYHVVSDSNECEADDCASKLIELTDAPDAAFKFRGLCTFCAEPATHKSPVSWDPVPVCKGHYGMELDFLDSEGMGLSLLTYKKNRG